LPDAAAKLKAGASGQRRIDAASDGGSGVVAGASLVGARFAGSSDAVLAKLGADAYF